MRRTLRGLAAAIALSVGALMLTPTPALAAKCWDDGCTGKDADVQNCGQRSVRVQYMIYSQMIGFYLRDSAACGASWVKIADDRPTNACDTIWAAQIVSRRWVDSANEFVIVSRQTVKQNSNTRCFGHQIWSKMLGNQGTSERIRVGRRTGSGIDWSWHSKWT